MVTILVSECCAFTSDAACVVELGDCCSAIVVGRSVTIGRACTRGASTFLAGAGFGVALISKQHQAKDTTKIIVGSACKTMYFLALKELFALTSINVNMLTTIATDSTM